VTYNLEKPSKSRFELRSTLKTKPVYYTEFLSGRPLESTTQNTYRLQFLLADPIVHRRISRTLFLFFLRIRLESASLPPLSVLIALLLLLTCYRLTFGEVRATFCCKRKIRDFFPPQNSIVFGFPLPNTASP
jgi:hypothetical protein